MHFLHGRGVPFATGISLTRPDLHVFMFGGDGDAFSIGGNHLDHAARKNVKMTYVIMDNFVYGLTKKQTSPTSPIGFKSKTDPGGAMDQPVNPMKKLIAAGATFVARTHSHLPNHVMEMMEKAMDHDGFSVIECLSECTEFYPGAFDAANPRKGGVFDAGPAVSRRNRRGRGVRARDGSVSGLLRRVLPDPAPDQERVGSRSDRQRQVPNGKRSGSRSAAKDVRPIQLMAASFRPV